MPFVGSLFCQSRYQPHTRSGRAGRRTSPESGNAEAARDTRDLGWARAAGGVASEQVGASALGQRVDDGLNGLGAVESRDEDGVGS